MNKYNFDIKLKELKKVDVTIKGYNDDRYEDDEEFEKWIQLYNVDKNKYSKELSGKKPNMASYGSSSRFIVKTFKDVKGLSLININTSSVEFEKIMLGKVKANFDMFCEYNNDRYYFEGKCHEIFDSHTPKFAKSYSKILKANNINYKNHKTDDKRIVIVDDIFMGLKGRLSFDIKQFICHVLSIVDNKNPNGDDYLVYLLYAPRHLKDECSNIYKKFEEEYRLAISYIQKTIDISCSVKFKLFYKVSIEDIEPIKFEEVTL